MKMRLLYMTTWTFHGQGNSGIEKKIQQHLKVFGDEGHEITVTGIYQGRTFWHEKGRTRFLGQNGVFGKVNAHRLLAGQLRKQRFDCAYVRYNLSDPFLLRAVKYLRKNGARIVLEIPTYPYEAECRNTWMDRINLALDRHYRKKLKRYVGRVVTYYTDETSVFDIPVIRTSNGIDFSRFSLRCPQPPVGFADMPARAAAQGGQPPGAWDKRPIRLLAVSNVGMWHGYDRLIRGLHAYYAGGGARNLQFFVVGGGAILEEYGKMIKKWNLSDHIFLEGPKSGAQLEQYYDNCDLAVDGFGYHRKGMTKSSSLKTREYGAKGIPVITACEIDIFPSDRYDFILKVPADESDVRVEDIIAFYDRLYGNGQESPLQLAERIRGCAEEKCEIHAMMAPVLAYLQTV